jgi:hypothetical protein
MQCRAQSEIRSFVLCSGRGLSSAAQMRAGVFDAGFCLPYPARESAVKSREKRENESKKAGSLSLRAPASVKIYLVPRKGL